MWTCPICEADNDDGATRCTTCGEPRPGSQDLAFQTISTKPLPLPAKDEIRQYTGPLPEHTMVVLRIAGESVSFPARFQVIIGRKTPDAQGKLVDLNPFHGYELGVSRSHARVQLNDDGYLEIADLGSANGTFLNGVRLQPIRPYRLANGDELRFAELVTHVYVEADETPEDS